MEAPILRRSRRILDKNIGGVGACTNSDQSEPLFTKTARKTLKVDTRSGRIIAGDSKGVLLNLDDNPHQEKRTIVTKTQNGATHYSSLDLDTEAKSIAIRSEGYNFTSANYYLDGDVAANVVKEGNSAILNLDVNANIKAEAIMVEGGTDSSRVPDFNPNACIEANALTKNQQCCSMPSGLSQKRDHHPPEQTSKHPPTSQKRKKPSTDDLQTKATKAQRKTKKPKDDQKSGQLYGNPAVGTIITWGSRTCKQPKIYAVPKTDSESSLASESTWHESAAKIRIARTKASIPKLPPGQEETRLREFQSERPDWFDAFYDRALTERMFVLNRERGFEDDCHAHHYDCPYETVQIAGKSGNVYTVRISHLPSCTCPVGVFTGKGKEKLCKHILYVMHFVLKAPEHHMYQTAFLTSELKELFTHAIPVEDHHAHPTTDSRANSRKPIEGDCPICFMEFEPDEKIVWCEALCGNNIHKTCFDQWAHAKAAVTCPFCRSSWGPARPKPTHMISVAGIDVEAGRTGGSYSNVRDQLAHLAH